MTDDHKPREGSKLRWKDEGDGSGRMRYEKSHPWHFTEPLGVDLEGGCSCKRNAFGWKTGCPHLGTPRKALPHVKAKGRF